ncbi:SGNH/GDSL hydrolase family protein [Pantoea vagans]|uniref:SGNH/GDSL hydrolase family protein n=1 Tax=Pantoea vagans TaxID=470934 RepID=UPI003FA361A6
MTLVTSNGEWKLSKPVQVPTSFTVALTAGQQVKLGGLWLTATKPHGVIVSALGLNGAQISMLEKWQSNWTDTLALLKPDLIVLAYGTNESFNTDISLDEYRQTLVRQIRKIRRSTPEAAILLVGPGSSIMRKSAVGCGQRQSPLLKPIIEVQKQVAKSEHTLFWDWFSWMGGDCAIEHFAAQDKARPDLIHLTAEGYEDSAAGLWQDLSKKLKLSQ